MLLRCIVCIGLLFNNISYAQSARSAAIAVEIAHASAIPKIQVLEAVGSLLPAASVVIKPEIAGKITRIDFEEGKEVAQGHVLIELDNATAMAQLKEDKAKRLLAEQNLKRLSAAQGGSSAQQIDTAKAVLLQAQASVDKAQAQYDKTQLKAPFSGRIGLTDIQMGDYVQAGAALVGLVDSSRLKLEFTIPERQAHLIALGQEVRFVTDQSAAKASTAVIYGLSPEIDLQGRSLTVRAWVDNKEALFIAGIFARVTIDVPQQGKVVVVPEEVVFAQNNKQWVYVVKNKPDSDQRYVQLIEVRIGQRHQGQIEILSGLNEGDQVVKAGQLKLKEGSIITVAALMH